jgi:hypothetical protein
MRVNLADYLSPRLKPQAFADDRIRVVQSRFAHRGGNEWKGVKK